MDYTISPTELRMGNWVFSNKLHKPITMSSINSHINEYGIEYEPIWLTETWLKEFGFVKDENIGYDDYMYTKGIFTLFINKSRPENDHYTYPILMRYGSPNEYKSGRAIFYVHQLQNLYYAIEGMELEIQSNWIPKEASKFSDLEVGDTIQFLTSDETFTIDKIFDDGYVDMTSTKPYSESLGLLFKPKFYSIKLVNFFIVWPQKAKEKE